MNTAKTKALANSLKRPIKTSKLNPYGMKKLVPTGEIRVAPRVSPGFNAIDIAHGKTKAAGVPYRKLTQNQKHTVAESKAYYATDKQDARATAASMVRRYRATGNLSAVQRLTNLSADMDAVIEFAKQDLGQTEEERYGPMGGCCSPSTKPGKKYYPSLYLSNRSSIDLPTKGKATIEYVMRSKTTRTDENGKLQESADIDILSIDPEVEEAEELLEGQAKPLAAVKEFAALRDLIQA